MDVGLDILGAGEGLASQYIVIRVRKIDTAKLKARVGGTAGSMLPSMLAVVDSFPAQALEIAIPFVKKEMLGAGIDAEVTATTAPPPPAPPTKPLLALGVALGGGLVVGGFYLYRWLAPKFGAKVLK